jgi:recombination protein RecT
MNLIQYVQDQEQFFTPVISDPSIKWEREQQFCIQAIQNNDYLAKIATSNPASFQNAIINVANIGVSLNPAAKLAYLVPRDGKVCLDVSYMGLMHIATTEGSIVWGQAKLVRERDQYINKGLTKEPEHQYKAFGDRGSVIGAYCTVKLTTGDYMTEEMDIDDLNKVRDSSKAKKGPWQMWPEEMMRKTVVKRASKYWPKPQSSRLDAAVEMLNTDNGEGLEKNILCSPEQKDRLLEVCDIMSKSFNEALKVINAGREDKFESINEVHYDSMSKFLDWASTMVNYFNSYSPMIDALDSGDEQYIYECIEELTEDDQFYVWRAFTKFGFISGEKQRELRAVHAKIKASQNE